MHGTWRGIKILLSERFKLADKDRRFKFITYMCIPYKNSTVLGSLRVLEVLELFGVVPQAAPDI